MRRLRSPLAVAGLFLAIGVLLAWLAEGAAPARRPEPDFPRWLRPPEYDRLEARRTLPVPAPAAADDEGGPAGPRRIDPFLAALPRDPRTPVLVLEANALRHSRLGELFVDCVLRRPGVDGRDPLEAIRREAGIDPLKDVDRVAFSEHGVVVSGFFERAHFDRLETDSDVDARGADGRVYRERQPGSERVALGTWRTGLLVFGESGFVDETLARLDHPDPDARPAIPEYLTYGEAYGVVPGAALRGLFRGEQSDLGRRLAELASRIEIHADAMRDVAVVAHVAGEDAAGVDDLGKAFGAALAVGRLQAAARGDETIAGLLEHARVVRDAGGGFSLELALPVEVVEGWFAGCRSSLGSTVVVEPTDAPAPPP